MYLLALIYWRHWPTECEFPHSSTVCTHEHQVVREAFCVRINREAPGLEVNCVAWVRPGEGYWDPQ